MHSYRQTALYRTPIFIAACMGAFGILSQHGVPAFRHDWIWPASREQSLAFAFQGLWAWNPGSGGGPFGYPFPWLPNIIEGGLAALFTPLGGLAAFIVITLTLAGEGMFRLCRSHGGCYVPAIAAAMFYMASPVVFNEMQAGHLFFLFSLAVLPWVVLVAVPGWKCAIITGTLIGIGSAQHQFFVFAWLAVVVLRTSTLRSLRWVLCAFSASLAACSPQWVGLLFSPIASAQVPPFLHWELSQSVPISEAVRLVGYSPGYDARLAPFILVALSAIPLIAIAKAIATRSKIALRAFVLAIIGAVMTAGLYGPASAVLAFLFSHVVAFAFFRELYDFAAVTGFGFAVAIGTFPGARPQIVNNALLASDGLIIVIATILAAESSSGIPRFTLDLPTTPITSTSYRYLPLPATFPVRFSSSRASGFTPLILPMMDHPSAAQAQATYPTTFGSRLAEDASPGAAAELRRLGIGNVIVTPLQSGFREIIEPNLRDTAIDIAVHGKELSQVAPRVAVAPVDSATGTIESQYTGVRILRPDLVVTDLQPHVVLDPREGWVHTTLWPDLPPWAYAAPLATFTQRRSVPAQFRAPAYVEAANARGDVSGLGCRLDRQLSVHWRVLFCERNVTLRGAPPIVLSGTTEIKPEYRASRPTGGVGAYRPLLSLPIVEVGYVDAVAGSAIVLRESYDSQWKATIAGAHVKVDGYANAWITNSGTKSMIAMWYLPGFIRLLAILLSAALLAFAFAARRAPRAQRR